jgi:hypothetical protein
MLILQSALFACAIVAARRNIFYFPSFVLIVLRSALNKMYKRKIPSDKNTTNAKNKRHVITLEQKFDD